MGCRWTTPKIQKTKLLFPTLMYLYHHAFILFTVYYDLQSQLYKIVLNNLIVIKSSSAHLFIIYLNMLLKQIVGFKFCNTARLPSSYSQNFRRVLTEDNDILFNTLTPNKIVQELDKKVIGQNDAKRVLAVAFRNRLRRLKVPIDIRPSIRPSNILMQGPTGCGKTQLCKALAALSDAPFVRVEATKYTQVGYVGKDVTSVGIDLMRQATIKTKQKLAKKQKIQIQKVKQLVYQQVVNSMLGVQNKGTQTWLNRLQDVKNGLWNDRELSILPDTFFPDKNSVLTQFDAQIVRVSATVIELVESLKIVYEKKIKQFFSKVLDTDEQIIKNAEQNGIIFIDQVDKIAVSSSTMQTTKGVSTEGVQRDFLPLLEGTTLPTSTSDKSAKFMRTDNILFIAGGSFARVKVEDLLPELLGRLPVKVNLSDIKQNDLVKILRKQNGLIQQQIQLLKPQGVSLQFSNESVQQIARMAYQMNLNTQNTGARRLSTMIDTIMKDYSFKAHEYSGTTLIITKQYVREKLKNVESNFDLRKRLI